MIRDDIAAAQIAAMKARDKGTVDATRLIQAAIKNRDIELRTATTMPDDNLMVTEVLGKMIKQRRESIDMFEKGGRPELAANEAAEVAVIERFLPTQMTEEEATAAIDAVATELGATSVKDMGRVMAAVKAAHAGKMDMARASALVKARLAG
ncbi:MULTISPECIES: GatB/YqeY domain-containing protein [Sphingomonas]|uniref:GatB/YqeY domain-containing protein n=2 Tax=Sphingomonas TaxID=13687 RepID=A0A7W9F1M5_9SPHN|nr:GatB/YqeY domain-containing protein [Sphingomonas prati]MBB5729421.1 hypothetical protein [Sphingomonas prati]GGE77555.1 aspartyl-tRNA amidotransferase subunit B [Sphingomonas prati]